MIALIEKHQDAIEELCREYGVVRLELFGSAARGNFDSERSDIDFLVEYPDDYDFGLWLTRFFEFKAGLEAILNRPVDLVMTRAMRDPYFIESVNESRQVLYGT